MLPGEQWHGDDDDIARLPNRDRFFEDYVEASLSQPVYEDFIPFAPAAFDLTHDELRAYFNGLAGSQLAREIASHGLTLELTGHERTLTSYVTFEDGEIRYRPTDAPVGHDEADTDNHVVI